MSPNRKNVVAVTPGGPIDQDQVVGYVCWYNIPDEPVSLGRMKKVWAMAGLDPTDLPKGTKAVHVFQRAVRSIESSHRGQDSSTRQTEIKVDEVILTPDECVYQVTQLVRDKQERLIQHPKAMRVNFDRKKETIGFNILGDIPKKDLLPLMQAINDFFDKNSAKLPGHKVRGLVRKYMKNLNGENLRGKSGGVYFIPASGLDTLESLATGLDELYSGKSELHMLPLVDTDAQREMIHKKHIANTMGDLDEVLLKTTNFLKSVQTGRTRRIRSDSVACLWKEHQEILNRAKEYKAILGETSQEVEDKLEVLAEQVSKVETEAGL